MKNRRPVTVTSIAALALLAVALPEPIVLDLLGVGLASIGLGLICVR